MVMTSAMMAAMELMTVTVSGNGAANTANERPYGSSHHRAADGPADRALGGVAGTDCAGRQDDKAG